MRILGQKMFKVRLTLLPHTTRRNINLVPAFPREFGGSIILTAG